MPARLSSIYSYSLLASLLSGASSHAQALEEIVVTASLRGQTISEVPVSITVLGESTLAAAGLQHFADVLGLVPNLNWSGGTSRPRFFQLRGIGELEQYQGAPNPSVGFLIDDIDLSGVGAPATLFDTEQVEVLRGPQGTRYGANALAGLIKIKTRDASPEADLTTELTGGEYGTWSAGVAGGGALGGGWPRSASQAMACNATHTSIGMIPTDVTNPRCAASCAWKWRPVGVQTSPGSMWTSTMASTRLRPTTRVAR
jgi:iron complex outermembrane recepter protein